GPVLPSGAHSMYGRLAVNEATFSEKDGKSGDPTPIFGDHRPSEPPEPGALASDENCRRGRVRRLTSAAEGEKRLPLVSPRTARQAARTSREARDRHGKEEPRHHRIRLVPLHRREHRAQPHVLYGKARFQAHLPI